MAERKPKNWDKYIELPEGILPQDEGGKWGQYQVQQQPSRSERITQAQQETPGRIAERGTIQQEVADIGRSMGPGVGKEGTMAQVGDIAKGVGRGLLTGISAIPQAIESGISNVALEAQRIAPDPLQPDQDRPTIGGTVMEGLKGLTLQKRGKIEDVYRGAGFGKIGSMIAGVGTSLLIPVAIANKIQRTFGHIAKLSDKNINKAGELAVKATKEAKNIVGPKVTQAYNDLGPIQGDKAAFIQMFNSLPKVVKRRFKEVYGTVDDFIQDLPVQKVREFKQFLGKLKPSQWGKETKGLAENIDDIAMTDAYKQTAEIIQNAVKNTIGGKAGEEAATLLTKIDDMYEGVINAGRFIKRTVTDPTLKKVTKGGLLAGKMVKKGDTSARTATNMIKAAGGDANKYMNTAADLLSKFSRNKAIADFMKRATLMGGAGAAAGLVGGRFFGRGGGDSGGGSDKSNTN